jgi:tRNA dimethylallyltransferase
MVPISEKPQILVIVGETGSGKSNLAMKIAKKFNGEIISADSWIVYRGFDIGTAKPSPQEQNQLKHHLIDVAQPEAGFSAPLFKAQAEAAIQDIRSRGKLPVVVGGTGLYIDSFLFDYGFLPPSSEEERQRLNYLKLPELIEEAKSSKIDLTDVDLRNKRRIIRAMEAKGQKPTRKPLRKEALVVGIAPIREELRQNIERRVNTMLAKGLEKEVKQLAGRYGWDIEPMKGIGYQQWRNYFEGAQSLEQTKSRIISSSLNLAKKQRTWFRRNRHIVWFDSAGKAYILLTKIL